jgi:crossover junction endodeoxyribonuclease RuvC
VEHDGRQTRLLAHGAIRLAAREDFSRRLLKIHETLQKLIEEFHPDEMAVEDQFYLTNFKSVLKLGQVKGVVLLAAARAGLPAAEYSPLEIKSAVTGYGRAEKRQVQVMVKTLLGMSEFPQPHDAADALAIALCHLNTSATRRRTGG